jgi:hypothetical protein
VVLEGGCRRAGLLLLGVLLSYGVSAGQDRAPDRGGAAAETSVLTRFLARPDEPVTSYRAYRRMEVRGIGQRAWMNVRVDLDREHGFRWVIESEGGSKALRDKTLRRLLETEAEAHATGIAARSGLTQDNYQVEAAGRDPDGLVRLRARARRRDSVLIDGFFVVTPDSADLVRVEGSLARGLSFWIPRVAVTRQFARINGHRVVVRSDSTAYVRLLGESRLVVRYEYEMIDGEHVATTTPSVATIVTSSPIR